MKRNGPPPKPTALRLLQGNPSHRPLPKDEPRPEASLPDPPAHLRGLALEEWHRVAPRLARLGLLSEIDRASLAAYCDSYALWSAANELVELHGPMIDVENQYGKTVKKNPAITVRAEALREMRAFASEFGMTPSSRTRVRCDPPEKKDPLSAALDA